MRLRNLLATSFCLAIISLYVGPAAAEEGDGTAVYHNKLFAHGARLTHDIDTNEGGPVRSGAASFHALLFRNDADGSQSAVASR